MFPQLWNAIHVGRFKFFRIKLLISDPDRIAKIVENYDKEIKSIRNDTLKICWHMRGGITYEQAMNLSHDERNIIGEIIKENMETTKKTGLPYF